MAKQELVRVETRKGQGYKMLRSKAEQFVARNKGARIVDPQAASKPKPTSKGKKKAEKPEEPPADSEPSDEKKAES